MRIFVGTWTSSVAAVGSGGLVRLGLVVSAVLTLVTACDGEPPAPAAAALAIETTTLPPAVVDFAYRAPIVVRGGTAPYACTAMGLSAGACAGLVMSRDCSIGLEGTPTTVGTCDFTVRVADAAGGAATRPLSLAVIAGPGSRGHAYAAGLLARADYWKGYSLRPLRGEPAGTFRYENQLRGSREGGYAGSDAVLGTWINYDYSGDSDPQRQDAARVVIPAFAPPGSSLVATLVTAIDASQTSFEIVAPGTGSAWNSGSAVRVGNEIMTIVSFDAATRVLTVMRGTYLSAGGEAASAHAAGTAAARSTNTVPNAVHLPLGTADDNTYLFTWDGLWTDSYMNTGLTNYKTFNFISNAIWFETNTNLTGRAQASCFDPAIHFAGINARSYNSIPAGGSDWSMTDGNTLGPGVTENQPVRPMDAEICVRPNVWIRFWVRIEQRANDYDYLDFWLADEDTDAVRLFTRIPVSVRTTSTPPNSIEEFYLEFNTSTDDYTRGAVRDLVAYMRNVVALREIDGSLDDENIPPLLVRPLRD